MRELVYYVAVSLDGFIAGPDGQFDAFPVQGDHMAALLEQYADAVPGHVAQMLAIKADGSTFDTVLMGWNTYDVGLREGLDSPYPHLRQYVFSRTRSSSRPEVTVTGRDPREVVRELKAEESGSAIWLCGGGRLAGAVLAEIDRFVLKINPVLLGAGVRLVESADYAPLALELTAGTRYRSGVTVNEYRLAGG